MTTGLAGRLKLGPTARILCGILLLLLWACQPLPKPAVETMPAYEAIFAPSQGWIGADAIYSVRLAPERMLWLFGDTFLGRVEGGRRLDAVIVNNTVAVQAGRLPDGAAVGFYTGFHVDGSPAAVIRPADGRGWFWIYDGIQTGSGLYLFLVQIERSEDPSVFGFRLIGNWLTRIPNPQEPPDRWRMEQKRMPWTVAAGRDQAVFGSALLVAGNDLYVYGARDGVVDGRLQKNMVIARVPVDRLEEFERWRFYSDGEWTAALEDASVVCEDVANEYSVSYLPRLDKYVLVYSESGLSPYILARAASDPVGPWSAPIQLYRCPEADWDARVFCYAGKAHPEVSTLPGELIVTYVSNATDLKLLEEDARLYRPRFLRVTFMP